MTIRAQTTQPDPAWWPMAVQRRVRAVVPAGVRVAAREDPWRQTLEVMLSESWWRGWARRLGLARVSRPGVVVRATIELADAPAGLWVRVGWR